MYSIFLPVNVLFKISRTIACVLTHRTMQSRLAVLQLKGQTRSQRRPLTVTAVLRTQITITVKHCLNPNINTKIMCTHSQITITVLYRNIKSNTIATIIIKLLKFNSVKVKLVTICKKAIKNQNFKFAAQKINISVKLCQLFHPIFKVTFLKTPKNLLFQKYTHLWCKIYVIHSCNAIAATRTTLAVTGIRRQAPVVAALSIKTITFTVTILSYNKNGQHYFYCHKINFELLISYSLLLFYFTFC